MTGQEEPATTGGDLPPEVAAELQSVAAGKAARAAMLHEALRRLAGGAGGPELQEMARDVLAGRISLRRAVHSSAYAEALWPHAERLVRMRDRLWPERQEGGTGPPESLGDRRPGPAGGSMGPGDQAEGLFKTPVPGGSRLMCAE